MTMWESTGSKCIAFAQKVCVWRCTIFAGDNLTLHTRNQRRRVHSLNLIMGAAILKGKFHTIGIKSWKKSNELARVIKFRECILNCHILLIAPRLIVPNTQLWASAYPNSNAIFILLLIFLANNIVKSEDNLFVHLPGRNLTFFFCRTSLVLKYIQLYWSVAHHEQLAAALNFHQHGSYLPCCRSCQHVDI